MSLRRVKVFDDPLSFLNQTEELDEDDIEEIEDRLQSVLVATQQSTQLNNTPVDLSKVDEVVKVQESNTVQKTFVETQVVSVEPVASNVEKKSSSQVEPVANSEEIENKEENIFGQQPTSNKPLEVKPITNPILPIKKINNTNANNSKILLESEEDISDLTAVASLLEREDNLDYSVFGKTEMNVNSKVRVQRSQEALAEEEAFLAQLDQITHFDTTVVKPSNDAQASIGKQIGQQEEGRQVELVDVHDVEDYIAQQLRESEGGLFD